MIAPSPPSGSAAVPAAAESSRRLHALDGLRATAMLLGVVVHAGMVYVPADIPGVMLDRKTSLVLLADLGLIHSFRMQLFFVVAGFFAALVYHRHGAFGFLVHRTRRLFLPFVAGVVLVMPFVAVQIPRRITSRAPFQYPSHVLPGHLWFIEYLFVLCVIAFALIKLLPPSLRGALARRLDHGFSILLAWRWKPLLLAIPAGVALWFSPLWAEIESPLPGISYVPTLRALFYYGFYFLFGWLLCRQAGGLRWLEGPVWGKALAALLAFPLMLGLFVSWMTLKDQGDAWLLKAAGIWLHELVTWLWIFAFFAFFLKRCARPRPVMRYLADASYWVYLVHLPLVLWLQFQAADWEVNAWVKFGFVYVGAMALLLLSYHWLVRRTFVGVFLNGRRGGA